MRFANLSVAKKIYAIAILIIIIFTLGISWIYINYRNQFHQTARLKIMAATETAAGIVDHYSNLAKNGSMTKEQAQELAKTTIKNLRFQNGKIYFWINDTQPRMIVHPLKPELDGQDVSDIRDPDGKQIFVDVVKASTANGSGYVTYLWPKPGKDKPQPKLSFVKKNQEWGWITGCGIYTDDLKAKISQAFYLVLGIILAAIAASGAGVFFLARSMTRPLKQAVDMMDEISKGHLDLRIKLNQKDEIGCMAQRMNSFADSLQYDVVDTLGKLANGNLDLNVVPHDGQDKMRGALEKLEQDLNQVMAAIQSAGNQISAGSVNVSDFSQTLSQSATESAASLEEISSSLNEMSGQTKLNADNATQVNQLSSEARQATEEGRAKMEKMVSAMAEISDAGQSINKIIKVIDEIAFQTNLLALNAAVEAARAGQHGKGFAVVAEEVRNLAARSAKAASETAELIAGSVEKTRNGAEIADRTASSLDSIFNGITKVSDLAEEIAVASNQQAEGIRQINEGLGQIDQAIQQNTATAEESAAAAEELSSQAAELLNMLKRFQLKGQFQRQPGLQAPTPTRAIKALPQQTGWGNLPNAGRNDKKPVINLDDDEFGKF